MTRCPSIPPLSSPPRRHHKGRSARARASVVNIKIQLYLLDVGIIIYHRPVSFRYVGYLTVSYAVVSLAAGVSVRVRGRPFPPLFASRFAAWLRAVGVALFGVSLPSAHVNQFRNFYIFASTVRNFLVAQYCTVFINNHGVRVRGVRDAAN